ncbi:hypothetical protein D1872_113260 [compost metagenome]
MAHDFKQAIERCSLPVSFTSKSVSLCHQTLNGKTRELFHTIEVFEVRSEGSIAAMIQESFNSNFIACLHSYTGFPSFLAVSTIIKFIEFGVFREQSINFFFLHSIDVLNKVANSEVVNGPSKLNLGFDLITFRNANITHIVAKAGDFDIEAFVISNRYIHPLCDLFLHFCTFPVTYNHFILFLQAGVDKPIFTVTMSCLIEVHEVHVNCSPRNAFIVLCGQMK